MVVSFLKYSLCDSFFKLFFLSAYEQPPGIGMFIITYSASFLTVTFMINLVSCPATNNDNDLLSKLVEISKLSFFKFGALSQYL